MSEANIASLTGSSPEPEQIRQIVEQSLDDDKAEEIVAIDLAGKTSIADYMVIASGRSTRQVGAMAEHLMHKLSQAGVKSVRVEGMPQNDWVLIDAGDVVVHVFRPEVRAFYNIEKMWSMEPATPERLVYLSAS